MEFLQKIDALLAESDQPAAVPLKWPDGEPMLTKDEQPAVVYVVGSESKKYRAVEDAASRKIARLGRKPEPHDWRRHRVDTALGALTGWTLPIEFTPENVRHLLKVDDVLDQIHAGIKAHADFLKSGSAS